MPTSPVPEHVFDGDLLEMQVGVEAGHQDADQSEGEQRQESDDDAE